MGADPALKSVVTPLFDDCYELLAIVGRGRSSVVYKARKLDPETKEPFRGQNVVALKVVNNKSAQSQSNIPRIKREAVCMLTARHPNVVTLFDYVTRDDWCYLAMEYVEGGDLQKLIAKTDMMFKPAEVLNVTRQLLAGLENIHRVGIVHRDIKPENLLVTCHGGLKITDFGIAYIPGQEVSPEEANRGVGTFDYLSPEMLEEGKNGPSTDIYAAAVTCYQLMTKHLPFVGSSFTEQVEAKMKGEVCPLGSFVTNPPPLFDEFFAKALSPDRERRFRTATEFDDAIGRLLVGEWRPEARPLKVEKPKEEFSEKPLLTAMPPVQEYRPVRPRWASWIQMLSALILTCIVGALVYHTLKNDGWTIKAKKAEFHSEEQISEPFPDLKPVKSFFSDEVRRVGLFSHLVSDNSDVSFGIERDNKSNKGVLSLGFPAGASGEIDIQALDRGEHVIVSAGTVELELWVDRQGSDRDIELRGFYKENFSGREGTWVLW